MYTITRKRIRRRKNITARSLDSGCNPLKHSQQMNTKMTSQREKRTKKSIFVTMDSMVEDFNGCEMSKKLNANFKLKLLQVRKQHARTIS